MKPPSASSGKKYSAFLKKQKSASLETREAAIYRLPGTASLIICAAEEECRINTV